MAGRTPEELETLLEDALVLGDAAALSALFAPGAVLAIDDASAARGEAIPEAALALWGNGRAYVADPRRVLAARDIRPNRHRAGRQRGAARNRRRLAVRHRAAKHRRH